MTFETCICIDDDLWFYIHHHPRARGINVSAVSRDALRKELEKRGIRIEHGAYRRWVDSPGM